MTDCPGGKKIFMEANLHFDRAVNYGNKSLSLKFDQYDNWISNQSDQIPNFTEAHIPMYIQERGFEIWTAAAILSLIGLFNVFGTLSFGYLSGKYSKKILLSILYFARGIVLILFLILPTSTYVAIGFGVLYGFLWLATIPPTNGVISQIFGTKYLATLYGIVFFSHQIGSFLGAYLGGYFYDEYGSFDYAWYLSIALSFFATLVHLPIDEKPLPRLATV